jgi:hypothetical protein
MIRRSIHTIMDVMLNLSLCFALIAFGLAMFKIAKSFVVSGI